MKSLYAFSALALLAMQGAAAADDAQKPQTPLGFVDFMTPTLKSPPPQTKEQVARGSAVGRYPREIEFLQPKLDPELERYKKVKKPLSGNYTLGASDVLAALTNQWAQAFMTIYPGVTIKIPGPYAGSLGAVELVKGSLQGVFVARELKPSDVSGFRAKFGYAPQSVPVAFGTYRQFGFIDTMVFVVHKDNPVESLSFNQLDAVLSTTRHRGSKPARTWGDLGVRTGPLKDKPVQVYGVAPWNGIEEFIRQRVLSTHGKRGEWRNGNASDPARDPNVHWDSVIFNTTRHAAEDPAGLAYTGLAYVDRPVKVLGLHSVSGNKSVNVSPTYETIARGHWPLTRVMYFNTNTKPNTTGDPVLRELTRFVLSAEGQRILLDQGVYLPFRRSQQKKSLRMLGSGKD